VLWLLSDCVRGHLLQKHLPYYITRKRLIVLSALAFPLTQYCLVLISERMFDVFLLPFVCCLLPAACCLLSAACCLLHASCPPAACCLLPADCCLLTAACCLLRVVFCLLFVICCMRA
jgi:hypothetical protein